MGVSPNSYNNFGDRHYASAGWDSWCLPADDDPIYQPAVSEEVDPRAAVVPANLKEIDLLKRLACSDPSGLLGTDDDRGFYRSGRRRLPM